MPKKIKKVKGGAGKAPKVEGEEETADVRQIIMGGKL
jgi:hypothetical protein